MTNFLTKITKEKLLSALYKEFNTQETCTKDVCEIIKFIEKYTENSSNN